ncbi:MAG: hypothetical protein ACFFDS_03945 [Candidatus Thorarchaeota archaeon]
MIASWRDIMESSYSEKELTILQTKFKMKQASEIYCELLKIREGLSNYTCPVRNLLQIFLGEMELHCSMDIYDYVENLKILLDEGITLTNWEKVNEIVLQFYSKIFSYCSRESLK